MQPSGCVSSVTAVTPMLAPVACNLASSTQQGEHGQDPDLDHEAPCLELGHAAVLSEESRSPIGMVNSSPEVTALAVIVPEHRKVPAEMLSHSDQWV